VSSGDENCFPLASISVQSNWLDEEPHYFTVHPTSLLPKPCVSLAEGYYVDRSVCLALLAPHQQRSKCRCKFWRWPKTKWMKNKTKQNLYKFIWEKVARKWRTKGVTELNYHQISLLIESFHDQKKIGAEYICAYCDQLWYRSSVSLCSKTSYNKCSKDIVDCCTCVTGVNSIDNKKWIC